jgi:hypothetical protein
MKKVIYLVVVTLILNINAISGELDKYITMNAINASCIKLMKFKEAYERSQGATDEDIERMFRECVHKGMIEEGLTNQDLDGKVPLTINVAPSDAKVRIMNIKPKYHDGIKLKPGSYHVVVDKKGFKSYDKWLKVNSDKSVFNIQLKSKGQQKVDLSSPLIYKSQTEDLKLTDERKAWYDEGSGLVWEIKSKQNFQDKYSWSNAKRYCEKLNVASLEWRLPSTRELKTLTFKTLGGTLKSNLYEVIINMGDHWKKKYTWDEIYHNLNYWSSDASHEHTLEALSIRYYFISDLDGYINSKEKKDENRVMCVAGNFKLSKPKLIRDNSKEVVIDKTNNLVWQDVKNPPELHFNEAKQYCETLEYIGFSDWRLPTIEELFLITEHTKRDPFVNRVFKNIKDYGQGGDSAWSSSETEDSKVRAMNFSMGRDSQYDKNSDSDYDKNYTRCVRGGQ